MYTSQLAMDENKNVVYFTMIILLSMLNFATPHSNQYNLESPWLSGKVVLITGASSGIGAATAIHFAKLGSKLALTGRNEANLEMVGKECEEVSGNKPLLIVADLEIEKDVDRVINSTLERYSVLDVLVNNAGMGWYGSMEHSNLEQFDKTFNLNVRAVFQLTKLAQPHLIASSGSIVNVSSVTSLRSFGGVLTYSMSKAALDQFTKCLAVEMGSHGVRVNSVNPGVIVTEIQKRGGMGEEEYAEYLERSKSTHALGRVGQPEEVARIIAFLASGDSAAFITGAIVPVDGGRHVMCPELL